MTIKNLQNLGNHVFERTLGPATSFLTDCLITKFIMNFFTQMIAEKLPSEKLTLKQDSEIVPEILIEDVERTGNNTPTSMATDTESLSSMGDILASNSDLISITSEESSKSNPSLDDSPSKDLIKEFEKAQFGENYKGLARFTLTPLDPIIIEHAKTQQELDTKITVFKKINDQISYIYTTNPKTRDLKPKIEKTLTYYEKENREILKPRKTLKERSEFYSDMDLKIKELEKILEGTKTKHLIYQEEIKKTPGISIPLWESLKVYRLSYK